MNAYRRFLFDSLIEKLTAEEGLAADVRALVIDSIQDMKWQILKLSFALQPKTIAALLTHHIYRKPLVLYFP